MNRSIPTCRAIASGLLLLTVASGCACSQPGQATKSVVSETVEAEPAKRPFVLKEASRPQGWPEPTPVGVVQVKQYPAYRAARVSAEDTAGTDNSMFRVLFNHIKRNDIAMTSPVEMTYEEDEARPTAMAFLYEAPTLGATGEDGVVEVRDVPAATVLSTGIRGGYNEAFFEVGLSRLRAWLADHPEYRVAGPPRYLGYNSPFVPGFLKYGEVQIPVTVGE